MKTKKISIFLIAIMLVQLLSFTAFAETSPVTGFNADTSGIYLYGNTLTQAMLEKSVLTEGSEKIPYTVAEVGITEAMRNNPAVMPPISNLIKNKAFKLTPAKKLEIEQTYSLSVNDGDNTVFTKTFFLKELFGDDFSEPGTNKYWPTGQASVEQADGVLKITGNDDWAAYRAVRLKNHEKYYDATDYTLELDFIPMVENSSAMGFAFSKTQLPEYEDGKNDARFVFDGSDGANATYSGVYSGYNGNYRASTPYFPDPSQQYKGLEAGRKYHIKAAFQEGNTNLGVYLSSVVNNSEVEYLLYDYDVKADGGAFSFIMNLKATDMPAEGPFVIFDNISMTKAIDVSTMQDVAIDEGTTLTSKGFTFYSAQNFETETLQKYINVSKNGVKLDGITVSKLNKKTITTEHQSTKAKDIMSISNAYRVTLPEQITQSGDIYTLEIFKGLTDSTGSCALKNNYSKNMMLNVLLYDNFDNYTGTVATGKDSSNNLVRTSEGIEEETWLGKAWTFDNNSSGSYDTHIVMSIDNGRLKVDYKTKEDDGKCQGSARIRSTAQDEHTEWKDYTVEYDLTALENAASYVGGVFPRANAMDNNKAPALYRSGFAAFGNSFAVVGTPDIPALNTVGHIEATAIAGTTDDAGSYSLIVDNDYFCKVTNNVNGTDFITATGTPHFAACSDQDFCMDNLVVSTFEEVPCNVSFENTAVNYIGGNNVADSTSISGDIKIINGFMEKKPVVVIMAAYDSTERQMTNAVILKNDDLRVGENSVSFTEFDVAGADSVKIFAFTSLDAIMPYDEAVTIN